MPMKQLEIKSFPWTPVCDICGEEGFECADDDLHTARREAANDNWFHLGEKVYCPNCVQEALETREPDVPMYRHLVYTLQDMEHKAREAETEAEDQIQEERRGKAFEY